MNLKDKVVFITGAGGGIGRAACLVCAKYGAYIVALDINKGEVEQTAIQVEKAGGSAIALTSDVANRELVREAVGKTLTRYGRIDVLFNNAGVSRMGRMLDIEDKDFEFVMNVNLKGMFIVATEVARVMKANNQGRIINASSIAAIREQYGSALYCMSKAAVSMMTKVLATELGQFNISSVALCPGNVDTEFLNTALHKHAESQGQTFDEFMKNNIKRIPLGRMATPYEIAEIVAFLCDERSYYINGNNFLVSGGMVMG